MTVDLSKLKVGDQVKFRNGEIDIVLGIKHDKTDKYPFSLFLNNHSIYHYTNTGNYVVDNCEYQVDIVEIIPQTNKNDLEIEKILNEHEKLFDRLAELEEQEKTNVFFKETLQGLNEALNHTQTYNIERDVNHKPFVDYNPATAKTDTGKDRLDLLPYAGLASAAKAFEYGLNEYGHNNYLIAKSYRPFLAAAERHLIKKLDGEDLDPDSGLDHVCHALACLLMAEKLKAQGKPMTDPDTHKPYGVRNKPKE